jgi:hypothetical protein
MFISWTVSSIFKITSGLEDPHPNLAENSASISTKVEDEAAGDIRCNVKQIYVVGYPSLV